MSKNKPESGLPGVSSPQGLHSRAIAALAGGRTAESIALLREAAGLFPGSGVIKADLAAAYLRSGNMAMAEECYYAAAAAEADNAYVLGKLCAFLLQNNRLQEAENLLRRAQNIAPNHPEVLNSMGLFRHKMDDLAAAQELFMRALKLAPGLAQAHVNLGDVLRNTNRQGLAEDAYRHALRLDPGNIDAVICLAGTCFLDKKQNRSDEAMSLLRQAMEQEPDNILPRLRLIATLEALNLVDDAMTELNKAKQRFRPGPGLVMAEARLLRRQEKYAEAISLLEAHEAHLGTDAPKAAAYYFELGQLYEHVGEADKAFLAFSAANARQAKTPKFRSFDKEASGRFIARMRRDFTPALVQSYKPAPAQSERRPPAFLVGFPRSGTTLLEQILSSCAGVQVGNEINAVEAVLMQTVAHFTDSDLRSPVQLPLEWAMDDPCYPACLANLTPGDIETMRKIFFTAHAAYVREGGGLLVDKMPFNLVQAGIINRMFPEARFILALRHPCDAVLSLFMQEFEPNTYMVRSLDLKDAATLYAETFDLWLHYVEVLKLDVHVIRYEDVVTDFRPTIEKLLQYLGLDWTDAIQEYHERAKRRGRIGTPSYHQVTRKIYTSASGRWQRYGKHLEPVLPILAPYASKFGYAIDPAGVE